MTACYTYYLRKPCDNCICDPHLAVTSAASSTRIAAYCETVTNSTATENCYFLPKIPFGCVCIASFDEKSWSRGISLCSHREPMFIKSVGRAKAIGRAMGMLHGKDEGEPVVALPRKYFDWKMYQIIFALKLSGYGPLVELFDIMFPYQTRGVRISLAQKNVKLTAFEKRIVTKPESI